MPNLDALLVQHPCWAVRAALDGCRAQGLKRQPDTDQVVVRAIHFKALLTHALPLGAVTLCPGQPRRSTKRRSTPTVRHAAVDGQEASQPPPTFRRVATQEPI